MRAASVVAGRFEIERLAGAGGMGSVYRARDRETARPVAVKVLKRSTDENARRFERECRILARLAHPAIVEYLAHGETDDGDLFLAMEWLEGSSLSERLAQRGLSVAESAALGRRIAAALAFAHASGVVHRDVKPSNIFLVAGGIEGAKILDFGIAHVAAPDAQITATGAMIGTPAYMAPEQARGERTIGPRADVFALGAVLYKCLTGRAPFAADDAFSMLLKVLSEPVQPPSTLRPNLPEDLDRLVVQMLARAPEDRPRDGAAVLAALESLAPLGELGAPPLHLRGPVLAEPDRWMVCLVAVALPDAAVALPDAAVALPDTAGTNLRTATPDLRTASPDPDAAGPALPPALVTIAARHRARVERRGDGAWALVVAEVDQETTVSNGRSGTERALSPTDLAMRAARCALAVQAATQGRARIAVASGRFAREGALPVQLVEGAFDLMDAEPGSPIRLDDVTASLLDARFDVASDGGRLALAGERGDSEVGRTLLGRPTSCVGREQEVVTLEAALAACADEHVARAVLVLGPAGMGKSRLRAELLRRVRRRGADVTVWVGAGDAIGHLSSFSLLGAALRRVLGIGDSDDPTSGEALAAALARRFAGPERTRMIDFLGALIGVAPAGEPSVELRAARRDSRLMADRIRLAWEDFVAAECARGPVLLVLEDVHWADAASIDFVDGALRRMQNGPFMVLALGRPETLDVFPALFRSRDVQEIRLGPLSRRAGERLVREVLGPARPDADVAALVDRAAGNPFYLEELIRASAEGSVATLPGSVRAMIEARLAVLDPTARRIVRAASVFGQTFWRGGVRAILGGDVGAEAIDERLADLVRRELCARTPLPRFADEVEYAFRHALLRDAAYATLSDDDGRLVHGLAAEWLEAAGERRPGVVAEHFERGGAPERAAPGYVRAAEQALESNDPLAAVRWTERAIACGLAGEAHGHALWIQAEAHNWHGSLADAERAALEARTKLPRGSATFFAAVGEAAVASARAGHLDTLLALVPDLLHPADGEEARERQVRAVSEAAIQMLFRARFAEADALFAWLDHGVTRLVDLDAKVAGPVAEACGWRALFAGDPALYLALSTTAAGAYEGIGDVRAGARALINVGYGSMQVGDFEGAERSLREALRATERLGGAAVVVRHNLGLALAHLGRIDEAIEVESAALAACDPANGRMIVGCHLYLALIHELAGRVGAAAPHVDAALEQSQAAPLLAFGFAVRARVLLGQGRPAEALDAATRAMELLGGLPRIDEGEAYIRLAYAEALRAAGDSEAARAAIHDAWTRLASRAEKIADEHVRERFLTKVPENARTAALARETLSD